MATEEKENPYQGGMGTGGKFRKRPFRRTHTTPYDRPPTSLRNPNRNNNGGWFSKLVDPAQRLITHGAHSLFSSLLRKRLPPPPPHSSETEHEVRHSHQKEAAFVANNSSGGQQGAVGKSNVQINCSDGGGLTELEKLLKQTTFTRSEIDHLTALMRSRTVDAPVREEEKRTETVPSEPMLPCGQKEEYPKTPTIENVVENRLVLTPHVTSSVPIEDVASPAELAKAYMGSRHSKVSSSMLGTRNPALVEDPTFLKSESFPYKSSTMSIVPRATRHAAVHENCFVTPRSRGRSAIYSMARTPYARIYPTSTLKCGGLAVQGEPSSSTQSALDHDMLSGSKQGVLKRRNLALDNDIGSVGPIRRIRHKFNLYSKGSSLPLSGSALSVSRSGLGIDAAQQPSSSRQKPILPNEVKHSHMELSEENVDDTKPSMSFRPFSSKSSEMASKILHQLDKLASPKEKSSESRLPFVNDNSSFKLSPSMLQGQALQSMEMADSAKLLDNLQGNKSDGTFRNLSASAQNQKLISQRDKVESGPLKLVAPSNELVPVITTTCATKPINQVLSSEKSIDSDMIKSVSHPSQKRRAFHMSADEDSLDLDDDAYPNGAFCFSPVEKKTTSLTAKAEKISSGSETGAQENPSTLSVVMPSKSFTIDGEAHANTTDGPRVGDKIEVSTSIISSISDPTYKPATAAVPAATMTSFGSDNPASPNGSIANPSLFNFGNKMVSSTELTAIGAPSKEITKSAPIFGLEKVVPSKEPGADAPSVNFGTAKNVNKVPPMPFTASTSVGGESTLKFGASSQSQLGSSISSTTVTGATDSMQKVRESDTGGAEINTDAGFSVRASEPAVSSAASISSLTSPTSIFNFGYSSNQSNGFLASGPSFSSSFPSLVSNNFTSSSLSYSASCGISATAASTGISMATSANTASSNNSFSTPVVATSSSTTSFFKFGSSPVPSTGLPASSSSSAPLETKSRKDAGISNLSTAAFGGSLAAVGSTGSAIFGFSSSAMTTATSQSQCSVLGASSSVLSTQASPSTSGFATSTQTPSVPFSSSASSPLFGLTGNTSFSSGSSLFPSSSSAANTSFSSGSSFFPSSSATNIFNPGTTFGLGISASSSAVNSISSNSGTSSTLFGTYSWQPSKSPFGSTFSSSSISDFSVGTSTASVASTGSPMMFSSITSASAPQFSFTSAAASTSTQPAFGSPNPIFSFGSVPLNNGQMSMEDSMAEDSVQVTPPVTPIFGQQPAPVQSNFVFGASTQSGTSPFQFSNQQNIAPQNPSPFQASGGLEFNAGGGSFSLGSGGGDKSGRKILRVKRRQGKK